MDLDGHEHKPEATTILGRGEIGEDGQAVLLAPRTAGRLAASRRGG
jgi:hypothetical protein